jgi:hypothetical protein
MSNGSAPADPPIIVQGGNSVDVDVPDKFKEHGTDKKGGKYRVEDRDLVSLTIDGKEYPLNATSRVEIRYGVRGGGKTGA